MTAQFSPPDAIHADLKKMPNWLAWRLVQKAGAKKPSKIPYYLNGAPRPGAQGTAEDRAQLAQYDQVVAMVANSHGHYTGVGFAVLPGDGIVALDYDNCVVGGEVDPRVGSMVEGTYAEISPSGTGVRAFMRGHLQSKKDTKGERTGAGGVALEVFGHNGFVTVTGNVLPECAMFSHDEVMLDVTPAVLADYSARWGVSAPVAGGPVDASADDVDSMMGLVSTIGLTPDAARAILADLDPATDRDHWLKVGMALHHEFGGTAVGLDLYDAWSSGGGSYAGRDDVVGRWNSFGKGGGGASPLTAKWLMSWRNETLARVRYDKAAGWKTQINASLDEFVMREKLCPMIAKDELGDLERETLAQCLFDRFKGLGSKYPIAACRKLIAMPRAIKNLADEAIPEWAGPFIWVTDQDKFFRLDSDEWLTKQSFNALFNRMMPVGEDGILKKQAADVALDQFRIGHATRGMYLPWGKSTFDMHGVKCVNTYRPSTVPAAVDVISAAGQGVINLFIAHLHMLCDGRAEVVTSLLSWLAHNAQRPGMKIRWAPLIKGVEGDGKTLFGHFAEAVMGSPNVKNISPTVLGTDFSDWAQGGCIGVLEEIKLTGHNKYDILNKIKPYVTNNTVPVHPKGGKEVNILNTMNYVAFTNFSDALPISDTDRRWMIVFSPFSNIGQLGEYVKKAGWESAGAYFDALYNGIVAQRGDLRRWLLDYAIPESFKPDGSAPHTKEKSQMVAMSASPEDELVLEAINEGGVGLASNVLSSPCLMAACALLDADISLASTTMNRVLNKLGWIKVAKKIKWKGRAHNVWTKGSVPGSTDQLRDILEKTLEKKPESLDEGSESDDLF